MEVLHPECDTLHHLDLVVCSFHVAVAPRVIKAVGDLLEPVVVGAQAVTPLLLPAFLSLFRPVCGKKASFTLLKVPRISLTKISTPRLSVRSMEGKYLAKSSP